MTKQRHTFIEHESCELLTQFESCADRKVGDRVDVVDMDDPTITHSGSIVEIHPATGGIEIRVSVPDFTT